MKKIDFNDDSFQDYYIGQFYSNNPMILSGQIDGSFQIIRLPNVLSDTLIIDTDIIAVKTKKKKTFLVSSVHVKDSTHKGVRLLNCSSLAYSEPELELNPISAYQYSTRETKPIISVSEALALITTPGLIVVIH